VNLDDVARIALALPDVQEGTSFRRRAWRVGGRKMVWHRPLTKAERAAVGAEGDELLAVLVEDEAEKQALVQGEPALFLTTAHFDGYPIVLVRLHAVDEQRLTEVIEQAWRSASIDGG
jgi:hypothetical protein